MSMLQVQAHNLTKRIFKLKKDFKELKDKYKNNKISSDDLVRELEELIITSNNINDYIDIVEEEIDKLVVRDFVETQDAMIKLKNSLVETCSV